MVIMDKVVFNHDMSRLNINNKKKQENKLSNKLSIDL